MTDHIDTTPGGGETPDPKIVYEAVYDAVKDAIHWPFGESILNVIHEAIYRSNLNILPPGSHLLLLEDDKWVRGIGVVALTDRNGQGEVMTERGHMTGLNETTRLVVGK